MNLGKNQFVQALGLAALVYIILQALAWGLDALLRLLQTFANWYRYIGVPYAEEFALAIGVIYLLLSAVISSKES